MVENLEPRQYKRHGFFTMLSFGMADLHLDMISGIFSQFLLLYWETEIGLNIWIYTSAYVIFVAWNMVNDPLIGYFADKPRNYWNRFGKRLPLIILGGLPLSIALPFVFNAPYWDVNTQQWYYFAWLLISICFYDSFYSLISLNHEALYPAKFRLDKNRRNTSAVRMMLQIVGTLLGAAAPMFMAYQDRDSYGQMAWIFGGIGFIIFLSYLPGHSESKEMRMEYENSALHGSEPQSFTRTLKVMLKQKNFMAVVLIFFLDSIIGASLSASVHYAVEYGLELPSENATWVLLGFIIAAFASIPIWLFIAQKWNNNRKMLILGVFLNTIFLLPLAFFWDLTSLIIFAAVLGVGGAALRVSRHPVMADVIDESIVKTGRHLEGSFMGIYTFFNRFALIAQQVIFAVVHTLTGFDPESPTQSSLALFGIRLHTAIIPMVLCLLGLLIFIKLYNLTPERTRRIKEQIIELGL